MKVRMAGTSTRHRGMLAEQSGFLSLVRVPHHMVAADPRRDGQLEVWGLRAQGALVPYVCSGPARWCPICAVHNAPPCSGHPGQVSTLPQQTASAQQHGPALPVWMAHVCIWRRAGQEQTGNRSAGARLADQIPGDVGRVEGRADDDVGVGQVPGHLAVLAVLV